MSMQTPQPPPNRDWLTRLRQANVAVPVAIFAVILLIAWRAAGIDLTRAIPGALAGILVVVIGALIWFAVDPIDF